MDTTVIKRIWQGLGANTYSQIVIVVIQLGSVPILLHYWGVIVYGEWVILFSIPSYLSMTDLGFSLSAGNDMTARIARGDTVGSLKVFQSLSALVYSVAAAGIILSAVLIALLPLQNILRFSELSIADVRWILWLLSAEVFIRLAEGVSHAGFRANGEYPLQVIIYDTTLLVQQAGIWLVVSLGCGPLIAAVWFAGVRILVTPSVAVLLFHRHHSLKPGFAHVQFSNLRNLVRPALANIAIPLAQALNIQGMVLVIGTIIGPAAVVTFTILRTLTRFALRITLSVSHTVEPELARAWGNQDMPLLRRLYIHSLRAGFWASLLAALVLYFLGGWIVVTWTQGRVTMNPLLFYWLLLSSVAAVLWYSGLILLRADNKHLHVAVWYVISSLLAVVVAALLLRTTANLANAGLALLVMDALMTVYVLYTISMITDLSVFKLMVRMLDLRPYMMKLYGIINHIS